MINLAATTMPRRTRSWKGKPAGARLPESKRSQNALRNYERYLELARAEALNGDLVAAENYLQHAEHYLRAMQESRAADGSSGGQEIPPKQRSNG
ncbi:DUF4167 domain-containing protein [Bradyrhizobium erythrophlei]|uniref:DUF4167 domain-containing protein n=1 Tax=Bradyrhizobium erythrophlei TaxID=1437360 RepID=UPI0035E5DDC3